jgi:hypothetical protein
MVAEDRVHAGDLIRMKLAGDRRGALVESVEDRGWISGVTNTAALERSPVSRRYSGSRAQAARRAQSKAGTIGFTPYPSVDGEGKRGDV